MNHIIILLLTIASLLVSGNAIAQKVDAKEVKVADQIKQIILPTVNMSDSRLEDVVAFLRLRSQELDPGKKGVNFIIHTKAGGKEVIQNLNVQNISMATAIEAIAQKTETKVVISDHAVIIVDREVALTEAYDYTNKGDDPLGDKNCVKVLKPGVAHLKQIVIPLVDFSNASLEECLDFLQLRSRELSPDRKGFNFIVGKKNTDTRINLKLRNTPLFDILSYVALLTNSQLKFTEDAVIITNKKVTLIEAHHYVNESDDADSDPFGGDNDVKVLKPGVARLKQVVIPLVAFSNSSLEECLDFLRLRSRELTPDKKRFNFIVGKENTDTRITLELRDASLFNVLRYVAFLTNSQLKFTEDAIFITPQRNNGVKKWGDLSKINIPHVSFSNVSPEDALVFIQASIKIQNPTNKTKITLGNQIPQDIQVNMRLVNTPASTVLEHLASACNATCHVSPKMVLIRSQTRKPLQPEKDPFSDTSAQKNSERKKNPFLRDGGKKKPAL